MTEEGLRAERLVRDFSGQRAVNDVSFDVAPGEVVALVGASGSGKTTTLRTVAGYERADSGRVTFGGEDITHLSPARRGFGMVFQHYALFPHMSVIDNVGFGLEARGVRKRERRDRAARALESVGLGGKGDRAVQQLSGGEQQRVALARALVIEPRMLLLDEPLSNLDPALRASTRDELRSTLKRTGAPALFVTHDQEDAFAIADRIVLLARGTVLQIGSTEELYARPVSAEVAGFIGHATLMRAIRRGERGEVTIGEATKAIPISAGSDVADGAEGRLVVRPENLRISTDAGGEGWGGTVTVRRFAGAAYMYRVRLQGSDIVPEIVSPEVIEPGTNVQVTIVSAVALVP